MKIYINANFDNGELYLYNQREGVKNMLFGNYLLRDKILFSMADVE